MYIKMPATLMLVKIFMRSERKWRNPFIDKSMTTNEISIEKVLSNTSINHRHWLLQFTVNIVASVPSNCFGKVAYPDASRFGLPSPLSFQRLAIVA